MIHTLFVTHDDHNFALVAAPSGEHGVFTIHVGETGASCYRGRLLQGHFMQNYYIKGQGKAKCPKKMAQKRVVLSLIIILYR